MTPAITAGLAISILTLAIGGAGAWTKLNNNVVTNTTLITSNSESDAERAGNLRDDLRELKDNDKETQRLLRELIKQQSEG